MQFLLKVSLKKNMAVFINKTQKKVGLDQLATVSMANTEYPADDSYGCHCRWDAYCAFYNLGKCETDTGCDIVYSGCGVFGMEPCIGECAFYYPRS